MILLAIDLPSALTIGQRARQKETIARMRSIVAALADDSQKHGAYPNADTVAAFNDRLPAEDGWGHSLQLHSRATEYVLTSYGLGGTADAQSSGGPTTQPKDDIVVRNGLFVRYPEGLQPQ